MEVVKTINTTYIELVLKLSEMFMLKPNIVFTIE